MTPKMIADAFKMNVKELAYFLGYSRQAIYQFFEYRHPDKERLKAAIDKLEKRSADMYWSESFEATNNKIGRMVIIEKLKTLMEE